jgi:hypothetical protein
VIHVRVLAVTGIPWKVLDGSHVEEVRTCERSEQLSRWAPITISRYPAGAVAFGVTLVGGAILGFGCAGHRDDVAGHSAPGPSTSTPTTSLRAPFPVPTTSVAPTTSTTTTTTLLLPAPVADHALQPGDAGTEVEALQHRLTELGYWLGEPDGVYGDLTTQAVLAFQKAGGLERTGVANEDTLVRLAFADRPGARATDTDHLEIDLERQLLLVVAGGDVQWALNTSTGARDGTPPGEFRVDREIDGMRRAPLGSLYRPKYFNRGIAIHGYPRVPAEAASHGCARVSYPAMDLLWSGLAPLGTTIWVY